MGRKGDLFRYSYGLGELPYQ
ncbi:MAG: hypothetical protein ACD_78C00275G0004, partial [uncultured bacterium (gcode 4)]